MYKVKNAKNEYRRRRSGLNIKQKQIVIVQEDVIMVNGSWTAPIRWQSQGLRDW